MEEWTPPGYETRDEWIDDLVERRVAALTPRQRFARWWWWNWPSVAVVAGLLAAVPIWMVTT